MTDDRLHQAHEKLDERQQRAEFLLHHYMTGSSIQARFICDLAQDDLRQVVSMRGVLERHVEWYDPRHKAGEPFECATCHSKDPWPCDEALAVFAALEIGEPA